MEIQTMLAQAMAAIEASDINKARTILWQIIEQNPDTETAWLLLAQVAQNQEHAISFLEQAQRVNPNNQTVADLIYKLRFGETQQLDLFPNRIRPNIFMAGISINNAPSPTPSAGEAIDFGLAKEPRPSPPLPRSPQVPGPTPVEPAQIKKSPVIPSPGRIEYQPPVQSPQRPEPVNREQVIPSGMTPPAGGYYAPQAGAVTPLQPVYRPEPAPTPVITAKPESLTRYVFLGLLLSIPAQFLSTIGAIILGVILIATSKGKPAGAIGKGIIYGSVLILACLGCAILVSLMNQ